MVLLGPMKLRAKSRAGMTVSTYALPAPMHRRVALAALEDQKTINVIVREALVLWLKTRQEQRRTKP